VLVVLVLCSIAIALPALPAQAAICLPYGIELSPKYGPPGTEVTVSGHDFAENTLVDIYYDGTRIITDRTDSNGDFTLRFTVTEDFRGPYEVFADVGYASANAYFIVMPGLTVSPEEGSVGTTVTVEGRGFDRNEAGITLMYYYLTGSYKTIERNIVANAKGSWETSFQIPPSSRGEHKLDAEGDVSKLYEVTDTIFRVTADISIDESSGIVGDTITITGSKFAVKEKGIQILFDGQPVVTDIEADGGGDWEAIFQLPEMPAGEYSVTAEGEQTEREDVGELSFQILPDIVLSPDEGYVGTDLTVTGYGFAADEDVVITYNSSQVATAETNDKGSFGVSFSVPPSQYGEQLVTAGYGEENHANAIFTMESDPPPVPTLISPSNKSRLGFMGEVTPTFEWSEVSDDSGVRYNLQIATSADVTATGEFVDPMVSITNLAETSYTVTEALPHGTYYWIVQAVDGADNNSDWTAAGSFRVGLLPLWGLIGIIIAAVIILVLIIRALIVRRSIYYDGW
jgi:hypothetical protein